MGRHREELLKATYLNQSDIACMLQVPRYQAKKIFDKAKELDEKQLKDLVIYDTKVRMQSVMKVTGINFNLLQKQIKE